MSTQSERFNKFCEFISHVVKRPAMYGVFNVEGINLLILGYTAGCNDSELEIMVIFISEFRDFINKEFADDFSNQTSRDWVRLIRFYSGGDLHSIELFGRWFDTFVASFKEAHKIQ